jgi:CHAT domain-containing protein/tetratricopeptide (TPR) repeat protein
MPLYLSFLLKQKVVMPHKPNMFRHKYFKWLFMLLLSLLATVALIPALNTAAMTAPELIQQGRQLYVAGQFEPALTRWQQAEKAYGQDTVGVTGSLINQAQAWEAMGHQRRACKLLVRSLTPNNPTAEQLCEPNQPSDRPFQSTLEPLELRAIGLSNLGNVLRLIGNLEASQQVLRQSLAITPADNKGSVLLRLGNTARDLGNRDRDRTNQIERSDTPNPPNQITSSGSRIRINQVTSSAPAAPTCTTPFNRSTRAITYYQQAIDCYQATAQLSPNSLPTIQAQLNHLGLLIDGGNWLRQVDRLDEADRWLAQYQPQITQLINQLQLQLNQLPNHHETLTAKINFAHNLTNYYQQSNLTSDAPEWRSIQQQLIQVIDQARNLKNLPTEAYALQNLGWLYEQTKQFPQALQQTNLALHRIQSLSLPDMTYQLEWQRGRILRQMGQSQPAIQAYDASVQALQQARGDLIAVNPDAQFSLRDTVEPLYREFIGLLLPTGSTPDPSHIRKSLGLIDSLQLTELENFFRCQILQARQFQIDQAEDPTAAIFHTIVLNDRVEVILKLPGRKELIHYNSMVRRQELEAQLAKFQGGMQDRSLGIQFQESSQQIYNWLLGPAKRYLDESQPAVKTLVFVLDGNLRNLPMSALYDGQQYLIEKYAVAMTPGLQLLGPKQFGDRSPAAVIAGLSTGNTVKIGGKTFSFSPLDNVLQEVEDIRQSLPQSQVLLDKDFTTDKFRASVRASAAPIVHIASHGQFSSNPDETFILTASEQPVDVNVLQNLLQTRSQSQPNPIELLVLSACETAQGDQRAALGLAGIAVRAGAFGTLASLWSVDDTSTALLMKQFYSELSRTDVRLSKVEALRQAQLKLLHDNAPTDRANSEDNDVPSPFIHPYFWAPFVLVGNWL